MSWMARLYETFEQGMLLDLPEDKKPVPVCHTVQNAHINIVIDGEGNFKRANVLEKTQIILPATEKSAGRSSGEAPHPLADKLQYVAGDYKDYGGIKAGFFNSYQLQLKQWCDSEFGRTNIAAVLEYVSKKTIIADLIKHQISWVDGRDILLTSWANDEVDPPKLFKVLPKEKGYLDQGNALVCWTVECPGVTSSDTWRDTELQQSWIDYESANVAKKGLCFVTGNNEPIALSHPAKIRHSGDKAKLISSNDLTGFTFKGRFTDNKISIKNYGMQGVSLGSLTSQKAHNALRWLINRQGFRNGDQALVAWAVSGKDIPDPMLATVDFDLDDFSESSTLVIDKANEENDKNLNHYSDMGQSFASKLNRYMAGYRSELGPGDQISIMAIDSATPGRMGVTYYREIIPNEYLDQITRWHNEFAWFQRVTKEIRQPNGKIRNQVVWPISSPAPFTIMNAVYGDILKGNASLKKNFYERLMPCIFEGCSLPFDLVNLSLNRARSPQGKDQWEWEKCLGVACSLYRGFYIRHPNIHKRKEFAMALDKSNSSRNYLYGRLLALAERIEEMALLTASVNRPTTASRLMQRFSDRPYSTWLTIYKQLDPYMRQLRVARAGFLANLNKELDEVMNLFNPDDFKLDKALDGEFLLGFHCQRLVLRQKKEPTTESEEGL